MKKSNAKENIGSGRNRSDLTLSNGAEVEFKMGIDENGMEVIRSLNVSFPKNAPIPSGGITAILLREIKIQEITKTVRQQAWKSELADERKVLAYVKNEFASNRRIYLDEFYAHLAFLYLFYMTSSPNSPTSKLSEALDIPRKTVVNRLTKARQLGMFEKTDFVYESSPSGKAGGQLSRLAMALIKQKKDEGY
jgi:hypothetical protein